MKKYLSLILLIFCLGLFLSLGVAEVKAATTSIKGITNVYANPGEETSSQITISWHSPVQMNTCKVTTKDDTNYEFANTYTVKGVLDDAQSFNKYEKASFYKCELELSNLSADTDYQYVISCINGTDMLTTENSYFKTAAITDFTFAWVSDIHAVPGDDGYTSGTKDANGKNVWVNHYRVKMAQKLVDYAAADKDINFIMTTGDEVWRGSSYSSYQEYYNYTDITKDYVWASVPGNHEYYSQYTSSIWNYYDTDHGVTSLDYSDHSAFTNQYFNAVKAMPNNGPTGTKYETSSSWFRYGTVLFIMIDSMGMNEYGEYSVLQKWFEDVMKVNEGLYQYIIVSWHYYVINPQTGAVSSSSYSMKNWYALFDKYGVDLCLTGHKHCYYRSYPLYDQKVSTEKGKGTTYMVAPQIGNRDGDYQIATTDNKAYIAKNIDDKTLVEKSGLSYFTVTPDDIKLKFIDGSGKVLDEATFAPKRDFDYSNYISSLEESITVKNNAEDSSVDVIIPSQYKFLVKNVKVKLDGNVVASSTLNDTNIIKVNNMPANKVSTLTLEFDYANNTTSKVDVIASTYPYYGEVFGLDTTINRGTAKINWNNNLVGNTVSKYEVYVDGEKVAAADANQESYSVEVEASKLNVESIISVKALTSDGNVIYQLFNTYHKYGDLNLDGKVDSKDLDLISEYIFKGVKLNSNALGLADINRDGTINYADLSLMWMYIKGQVQNLNTEEFVVTFKDSTGTILSVRTVNYGACLNETGLTKPGYTFMGWSESVSYVTKDMTVYAVYEKAK